MNVKTSHIGEKSNLQFSGIFYGIFAAFVWGGYLTLSSKGITDGLKAEDLTLLRYLTSGLLMLPFLFSKGVWVNLNIFRILSLAILGGPLFVLLSSGGYNFAPLAHGAVLQLGSMTLLSVGLAAFLFRETISSRQIKGIALVIAGLVIISGPALLQGGETVWLGDLMFVAAGAMWAVFAILVRRWEIRPVAAVAIVACLSAIIYAPAYFSLSDGLDRIMGVPFSVLLQHLIMQGVLAGIMAVFAYAKAIHSLGPGKAALFPAMSPAVAILLGIPLLGIYPSWMQVAGLIMVSGGILLSLKKQS